jgi:hypothetical protein
LIFILNILSVILNKNIFSFAVEFFRTARSNEKLPYLGFSLFLSILLLLLLQTNNQPMYDELWYSLRTHELLNSNGSFFQNIIYPDNWVVYYPKFYDILLFPLQTFPNYAFSKIFSVFNWIVITLISFALLSGDERLKTITNGQMIITLAIMVTPVLSNMAIITKGDIFSLLMFLFSFLFIKKFYDDGHIYHWVEGILLGLLICTIRLASIPSAFILIIGSTVLFISQLQKKKVIFKIEVIQYINIGVTLSLYLVLLFRTYHFTGVPIIQMERFPIIPQLYDLLNFKYNNEFLQPFYERPSERLPLLKFIIDTIIYPMNLRASRTWYSNFYLLLLLLVVVRFRSSVKEKKQNIFLIVFALLLILYFWFIRIYSYANQDYHGGDGNYYIIPTIISSLLLIYILLQHKKYYQFIVFISSSYLILHLALTFISGDNWEPGFKKTNFEMGLNPLKGTLNRDFYKQKAMARYSTEDIDSILSTDPKGIVAGGGHEKFNFYLGHSYLNLRNTRSYLFKDLGYFNRFMKNAHINYLLVQNFPNNSNFYKFAQIIKNDTNVVSHKGITMTLLDLKNYTYPTNYSLGNDSIPKKPRDLKVDNPILMYATNQKMPKRFKPLNYIENDKIFEKYYEQPITLLAKDCGCSFNFTNPRKTDIKIELIFSTDCFSKKIIGSGKAIVKVVDNNNQIIKEDSFVVTQDIIITPVYLLNQLKKGNYRIEVNFDNGEWSDWIFLAIATPKIYQTIL